MFHPYYFILIMENNLIYFLCLAEVDKIYNNMLRKGLVQLIFLLCLSLAQAQHYTNSHRTQNVGTFCAAFDDRSQLLNDESKQENEAYKTIIGGSLTADGNQLIKEFIDGSKGISDIQGMTNELVLFIGPFAVGMAIIVFIWMFLCCCCCCPQTCPPKCCRKPEDQPYSRCELLWPSVTLVLALLVVVIMSVIGITKAPEAEMAYKATTCSLSICYDDLINGNSSRSGNFFIGLDPLIKQLTELKDTHISTIQSSLDSIDSSVGTAPKTAFDKGELLINKLSILPTGTSGESMAAFTYNNFDGSSGTISSTFPDSLGGIDAQSGQLFTTSKTFEALDEEIQVIMQAADDFGASVPAFTAGIDSGLVELQKTIKSLEDAEESLILNLKTGLSLMQRATLTITLSFSFFIAFSILGIIGALLTSFGDKYNCRYLIYFSCSMLFLMAIVAFVVALFFSAFTPLIYYTCQFLDFSVESSQNFIDNFSAFMDEEAAKDISVCLTGQSGKILKAVSPQIHATIDPMGVAINGMANFNTLQNQNTIRGSWQDLSDLITETYRSTRLDWASVSNKVIIKNMANPTTYSGCNANSFGDDSWVPSVESSASIACRSATGVSVTDVQCDNSAIIAGQDNAPGTCYGCIDSFLVLKQSPSTIADDLKSRYSDGGSCDTFADDMQILWDNYYSVKIVQWDDSSLNSRLAASETHFSHASTGYYALVGNVGTAFQNILDSWTGDIDSVTNTEYGMVGGLNCVIFGENLQTFIDTTCIRLFNIVYMIRYTTGISALSILFVMCCGTCTGVRHYRLASTKVKMNPETTRRNPKKKGKYEELEKERRRERERERELEERERERAMAREREKERERKSLDMSLQNLNIEEYETSVSRVNPKRRRYR